MDEDGGTDCLKDDMPSLPLRHVSSQKSMVPGLDELGTMMTSHISECLWMVAARPELW